MKLIIYILRSRAVKMASLGKENKTIIFNQNLLQYGACGFNKDRRNYNNTKPTATRLGIEILWELFAHASTVSLLNVTCNNVALQNLYPWHQPKYLSPFKLMACLHLLRILRNFF